MVQTILFPTDGSDTSLRALQKAIHIAKPFDSTIHAVSVIPTITERHGRSSDPEGDATEAIETARELVEREDLEFVGETREGVPSRQIVEYSHEHDIDMIVMGTHGRTGLDRVLIGSVAERTVRTASIPVLTVPPRVVKMGRE